MDEIEPGIFLGSMICCEEHFIEFFPDLKMRSVLHVISVGEEPTIPLGAKSHLFIDVADGEPLSYEQLESGIEEIVRARSAGEPVYIHCLNGYGRSTMLLSAYYISKGDEVEAALQKIKAKRPEISLNRQQYSGLYDFKKRLGEMRDKI